MNKLHFIIAFTVIAGISFLLGLLVNDIPFFTLDRSLSLGDVSGFFLTIIIALFVPFYLNKSIDVKRAAKNIVIQSCGQLEDSITSLLEMLVDLHANSELMSKEDANLIILKVRSISNMAERLKTQCIKLDHSRKTYESTSAIESIQISFWQNVTINLRDDEPKLTVESFMRTEEEITKYLEKLSELKMHINNL